jgi:hypothetical protein
LKCEFTVAKFKLFLRTDSSWSVRTFSQRLRIKF